MPDVLSVQDIALACHLGYIQNRPIGINPKLEKYPKVQKMIDRLGERDSFRSHPIRWWEPEAGSGMDISS